jgi:pyruvate dehydrogenase E1 component beta subunit
MTAMNMVEALNLAFKQEMKNDKNIVMLGEDVAKLGGVFRVTTGLKDLYKERVFNTPLAEAGIVGTSIGMAIYGLKPIAEIQFSGFIYPAFQQIVSHLARFRNRTRGRYSCPVVVRAPYSGGVKALEHHSESMEAIFAHVQGLKVVIPSSPSEAKGLIISAIRDPDPVIFFEPKRIYRSFKEDVEQKEYSIPIGVANIVEEGSDLTLVSWGASLHEAMAAAADVEYSIEIIDVRTISPLDINTIVNSVKKTGRCVIVHEAPRSCGLAAEIIAQINEKALDKVEAPIERVTGFDVPMPFPKLEWKYIPDPFRIKKAIEKVMGY